MNMNCVYVNIYRFFNQFKNLICQISPNHRLSSHQMSMGATCAEQLFLYFSHCPRRHVAFSKAIHKVC